MWYIITAFKSLYCATYLSTQLHAPSLIRVKCFPCHPTTCCGVCYCYCYCYSSSKMQRNLINLLLLLIIFLHFTYLLSASHLPLTSKIFIGYLIYWFFSFLLSFYVNFQIYDEFDCFVWLQEPEIWKLMKRNFLPCLLLGSVLLTLQSLS